MPAELFVDTSAWFTLAIRRNPGHDRTAGALRSRIAGGARVVDAVSFAVMTARGIREALALDHRFAAAGFVVLG